MQNIQHLSFMEPNTCYHNKCGRLPHITQIPQLKRMQLLLLHSLCHAAQCTHYMHPSNRKGQSTTTFTPHYTILTHSILQPPRCYYNALLAYIQAQITKTLARHLVRHIHCTMHSNSMHMRVSMYPHQTDQQSVVQANQLSSNGTQKCRVSHYKTLVCLQV